jgi:hypothetical protein
VLVSAPAGAGKTTLLLELAESGQRPCAWLHLDDADNDPVVLLLYLTTALSRVAAVDPGLTDVLGLPAPSQCPTIAYQLYPACFLKLPRRPWHLLSQYCCLLRLPQ